MQAWLHVDVNQIGDELLRLQRLREEVEARIKYFEELLKKYNAIGDQNRMLTIKLAAQNSKLKKYKQKLQKLSILSGEEGQQVSKSIENVEKAVNLLNKQLNDGKAKQDDIYKKMIEVKQELDESETHLNELVRKMKEAAKRIKVQKVEKTMAVQDVLCSPQTSGKGYIAYHASGNYLDMYIYRIVENF